MGRGRAKAKQTKVARRLKYTTTGTDLDALKAELTGQTDTEPVAEAEVEDDDDPYAEYAEYDDEDDQDDEDTVAR